MVKFSDWAMRNEQEKRLTDPRQVTLEFKLEAVRPVKGGQAVPMTVRTLGVPMQTLGNWVRLSEKGQLKGAGDKPVSVE